MTQRTFHTDAEHVTRDGRKAKITEFNKGGYHHGWIMDRVGRRKPAFWMPDGAHWYYEGRRPHANDLFDVEEQHND